MPEKTSPYLAPYVAHDDNSRAYHAVQGAPPDLVGEIFLIKLRHPNGRAVSFRAAHIRHMNLAEDDGLLIVHVQHLDPVLELEGPAFTVWITGRNLAHVANALAEGCCYCLEAFNPQKRDMAADSDAPFIESITDDYPWRFRSTVITAPHR